MRKKQIRRIANVKVKAKLKWFTFCGQSCICISSSAKENVPSFIFCFLFFCSPVSEVKTETEVRKSPSVYSDCFMHVMIILLKKGFYGNAFTSCNCHVARCCINAG